MRYEVEIANLVTFPMYVHKLELAGQILYPNVTIDNITELRNLLNDSTNGYVFSSSGAILRYTGFSGLIIEINDATVLQFATTETSPDPAEDDKEYREWVEANVIRRYEAKLANAIADLQIQEKDSTFLTEYACECKKKDVVYLTRLIADIKKGMGEYDPFEDPRHKAYIRGRDDQEAYDKAKSGWISVKDRLPEKDMNVLALCDKTMYVLWYSNKFYMDFNIKKYFEDWTDQVTHWQPLPAPPKMNC